MTDDTPGTVNTNWFRAERKRAAQLVKVATLRNIPIDVRYSVAILRHAERHPRLAVL